MEIFLVHTEYLLQGFFVCFDSFPHDIATARSMGLQTATQIPVIRSRCKVWLQRPLRRGQIRGSVVRRGVGLTRPVEIL
jgi:hypothetical protein